LNSPILTVWKEVKRVCVFVWNRREILPRVRATLERLRPNVLSRLLLRRFGKDCDAGVALRNAFHAQTYRIPQNRALGYQPAEPLRYPNACSLTNRPYGANTPVQGQPTADRRFVSPWLWQSPIAPKLDRPLLPLGALTQLSRYHVGFQSIRMTVDIHSCSSFRHSCQTGPLDQVKGQALTQGL
jgi:hypothetical protein